MKLVNQTALLELDNATIFILFFVVVFTLFACQIVGTSTVL